MGPLACRHPGGPLGTGILLILVVVFLGSLVVDTVRFGAPPMPSSRVEREAVAMLVERCSIELARPARVVEAGAGWGGLALAVARAHPDCPVTAVEGAWVPALVCWGRTRLEHLLGGPDVAVRLGDVRRCELGDVDVVVAFLGPEATATLADHLAQMSPPPQLISVGFSVRSWRQRARVRLSDRWNSEVGLYACKETRFDAH